MISQVYGGGGSAGAPYTNDYVELFNGSGSAVNLTGYSVQYADATSASWSPTPLTPVSLANGSYYLVQEGSSGIAGSPLPTPDQPLGTTDLGATAGKVALVNTATLLSGTCPLGAEVVDFVGYGATANCSEGAGPAPAPSNTTADLRGAAGCIDTNNNSADFATGTPAPRNTSTPPNFCRTLSVSTSGTGSGIITGPGINCPSDCTQTYADGATVALTATPGSGSTFAAWGGDCSSSAGTTCNLTMNADHTATATFNAIPGATTLTVSTAGTGSGTITGPGIDCPGDCTETYAGGTSVTLTATPGSGSTLAGWGGDCSGSVGTACNLTMSADHTASAVFDAAPGSHRLGVSTSGTGSGTITGPGINCPGDCAETYAGATVVALTATPGAGSVFGGWGGDCSSSVSNKCNLTMSADRAASATFNFNPNTYQPDGLIKRSTDHAFIGGGIYNANAKGQTRGWKAHRGQRRKFEIKFENDGNAPDRFRLDGCASSRTISVRYFQHISDVTTAVAGGSYLTRPLAPGASTTIELRMKPSAHAQVGGKGSCRVTGKSTVQATRQDAVRARLKVVR